MRRLTIGLALLGIALGACLLSVTFLKSKLGERSVGALVKTIVNDEIPGEMTVDVFDDLELFSPPGIIRARAIDVRFFDPAGVEVIQVDYAVVEFDAVALLHGEVRFRRARVNGGVVTVQTTDGGGVGIDAAFDSHGPFHPSRFGIALHDMQVQNLRFVAHLTPTDTLEFDDLTGTVDVIIKADTPGATVNLRGFTGALDKPRPLGMHILLRAVDGAIHGGQAKVVDLAYRAKFGAGEIAGQFSLVPRDKRPARLSVLATGTAAKLATMVMDIKTTFGGALEIETLDAAD